MVGALARFCNNYEQIDPLAQSAARRLGLQTGCTNPYYLTTAQLVELFHYTQRAKNILQNILEKGIKPESPQKPQRYSGDGIGACEAPRGVLIHHYKINNGYVVEANLITPTAQNLANIEKDMRSLTPTLLDQTPRQIEHALQTLVRAYDPCISCSTHMLKVKFD